MSDSVVEHDVSGLVMSVDIRVDQSLLEERGAARVFFTEEHPPAPESAPPPRAPVAPASFPSTTTGGTATGTGIRRGDVRVGTGRWEPPAATATATPMPMPMPTGMGVDYGPLSAGVHKEALPEMLRLRDHFEK